MMGMGYIIAVVVLLIVVPLLFIALSRRTPTSGRIGQEPRGRGVTFSEPASDQPTPGDERSVNQPKPGTERRLPPG